MFCKYCGKPVNDGQYACLNCGVKVGDGQKYCATCGAEVMSEACVCVKCGAPIKKESKSSTASIKDDKTVMAIIALLLGGLGIHNFIMGENKKGIFRLLFSFILGIGWIFALIDFVKLLNGSYVVDPDAYV